MSRLFDGVDDQMVYASPVETTTNLTLLIVCKIAAGDGVWQSLIEQEHSSGFLRPAIGRANTGQLYYATSAGSSVNLAATAADNWAIYAVTKTAGTTTPDMHKIPIGSTRSTLAGGTALGDAGSYAGGTLRIGGNDDFANIYVAAAATWTRALSTTELDGLGTAKSTDAILALSPVWCVDDADGLATDLVGSVDRTTLVGTTDSADDPSGWTYFGEGPHPSKRYMWMP